MAERKYKNPQVNLRLPEELKVKVIELAEANGRSANAEMVAAIEAWVLKNKHVKTLDITAIAERVIALENEVAQLKKKPT
ncbi:Arc family DNA-binding protein [Salmonella enterica subsp. enterica]|uniref:Arc family DNA-binding protein n=1 Tax=Salmonella enterica TaxID=28901 RepID=A0A759LKD6_SALER|nr:Arc family DNA-binding protein [Salmonella enterica subsp. enterica serovar Richmond]ECJ6129042.1 Arc family DNA-binding protein [Salmonella enterica]EDD8833404.1 Arc family DNA-binding protein [Salmonella enterica subsp. enterica serovar Mikawasima]EBY7515084.1 Arc family DNA-binding protein [Salmonella enterica subsp. enterica serovar Richmond]ECD3840632.1 Arc family DNA-binding protein [Salmonella enterica subsp. enterica serovar Richmond]